MCVYFIEFFLMFLILVIPVTPVIIILEFICKNYSDSNFLYVSSPNTAGLRNLQQAENLQLLLGKVIEARNKLDQTKLPPILLKIAPDLTDNDVKDIVSVITKKQYRVDGLIISNTTVERNDFLQSKEKSETGGLSGAPLAKRSTKLIAKFYTLTKGKVPIIGVGGIFNGQVSFDKIIAGASAIQIYTSLICHGPPVVQKIKKELTDILESKGFKNIEVACGTQAKAIANEPI
ncbi:dihydroorotate dehydrogenase (quinone), mitochondrial-like [Sitodiplosis mosellana]|uniref:dihydroorotate dehydrogenase (quinone), mitochondrial-like n=1 Tax=Sitodiplosis mosellana TaxID=263140 RepID=UPI0024448262|nr:dihydroorotate dehydrogenase (quinone), mitochondrial-like [Sitodiplosis mosellana]